jgi:hypothetical protein
VCHRGGWTSSGGLRRPPAGAARGAGGALGRVARCVGLCLSLLSLVFFVFCLFFGLFLLCRFFCCGTIRLVLLSSVGGLLCGVSPFVSPSLRCSFQASSPSSIVPGGLPIAVCWVSTRGGPILRGRISSLLRLCCPARWTSTRSCRGPWRSLAGLSSVRCVSSRAIPSRRHPLGALSVSGDGRSVHRSVGFASRARSARSVCGVGRRSWPLRCSPRYPSHPSALRARLRRGRLTPPKECACVYVFWRKSHTK